MAKWERSSLDGVTFWPFNIKWEESVKRSRCTSKVNLKVKEQHSEEAALWATTRYVLLS